MEESGVDFLDQDMFSGSSSLECNLASNSSNTDMESFLEELMRSTHSCTHTHTCNPPTGPENRHTHTCYHTHTQLFAGKGEHRDGDEGDVQSEMQPGLGNGSSKKHRPVGNREAVKKYREKKKAHTAYLEEQVQQLKALNSQLVKRLQGQAALQAEVVRLRPFEAEAMRLRAMLAEFRGRIDGELSAYMSQLVQPQVQAQPVHQQVQPLPGGYYLNSFTVPCDAEVHCLHSNAGLRDSLNAPCQTLLAGQENEMADSLWLKECETEITDCEPVDKLKKHKQSSKRSCTGTSQT